MSQIPSRRVPRITSSDVPRINDLLVSGRQRSGLAEIPDFYSALANHPGVLERIINAGLGRLPDGVLGQRRRELLVLRTARLCGGTYEWAHHTRRAAERGLSVADVEHAWRGAGPLDGDVGPAPVDDVLLATVDELHYTSTLDDASWDALVDAVGVDGAIEAVTVIGWFHLISFLGNAVGLEIEEGVDRTFGPPSTGAGDGAEHDNEQGTK